MAQTIRSNFRDKEILWYNAAEAGAYAGVSAKTIQAWSYKQFIVTRNITNHRFSRVSIEQFLHERERVGRERVMAANKMARRIFAR